MWNHRARFARAQVLARLDRLTHGISIFDGIFSGAAKRHEDDPRGLQDSAREFNIIPEKASPSQLRKVGWGGAPSRNGHHMGVYILMDAS